MDFLQKKKKERPFVVVGGMLLCNLIFDKERSLLSKRANKQIDGIMN
jgi:hypothetical protein